MAEWVATFFISFATSSWWSIIIVFFKISKIITKEIAITKLIFIWVSFVFNFAVVIEICTEEINTLLWWLCRWFALCCFNFCWNCTLFYLGFCFWLFLFLSLIFQSKIFIIHIPVIISIIRWFWWWFGFLVFFFWINLRLVPIIIRSIFKLKSKVIINFLILPQLFNFVHGFFFFLLLRWSSRSYCFSFWFFLWLNLYNFFFFNLISSKSTNNSWWCGFYLFWLIRFDFGIAGWILLFILLIINKSFPIKEIRFSCRHSIILTWFLTTIRCTTCLWGFTFLLLEIVFVQFIQKFDYLWNEK